MSATGISTDELRKALAVLQSVVEDRALLASLTKEERAALMIAAGRMSRPARYEAMVLSRAVRKSERGKRQAQDREARAMTGIRSARRAEVFTAPVPVPLERARLTPTPELETPRACYVCKAEYRKLHFFYDAMCPDCGDFNYQKRFQTAPLEGRVAVITGARLKIGYQAALMMLRAGARVVVTTRFPHDAAQRYAREPDFAAWGERLQVHGLDLRHSPSVEVFCRFLDSTLGRLDILINNAAQTVRRPPGFYNHLLEDEARPVSALSEAARGLLRAHEECKAALAGVAADRAIGRGSAASEVREEAAEADMTGLAAWHAGGPGIGLRESAKLSQLRYAYDDAVSGLEVFPEGRTDADLQQVDLRKVNSWRLTLAEVPTPEMLEVQLVNAVAPFILCGKLKPLMLRDATGEKHVVNVSAMEGSFSRGTKTDKHPHTNMAKAALNMMTLTSARDYVKDGIHMNAVDTGWVTDEDPVQHATRKREDHDFQPPLDIVDGAARVCDPFFNGLREGRHDWGKFFKDYKPTGW